MDGDEERERERVKRSLVWRGDGSGGQERGGERGDKRRRDQDQAMVK